jgi:hypothetical protein
VPCYNFTKYISTKHDEYLDGNLTSLTHEAMMSMAKRMFDFLKTKGKWGANSPDDEKIVAMAAEINSLKGKLKLDPKLSAIAGEGKKDDGSKKKKNKKNTSNKKEQKKDEAWKKEPPKCGRAKQASKSDSIPSIGASTSWHGLSTSLLIAILASNARTSRRSPRPTLPPSLLLPPRPSIPISPPSWPPWPTWIKMNDGSCRHTCISC